MNSQEILSVYETVSGISDDMLRAARNGDWDELALLESRCTMQVDLLRQDDSPPRDANREIRERKAKIIRHILDNDREIRAITEPWMAKLTALINSTGAERKLSQAYGAHQTG